MGDVAGADPVVVNRFLSWGLGALCATLIVLAGSVTITVPPTHALVQVSMMGVGLLGSQLQVHISSPSSPPVAYLDWIRALAAEVGIRGKSPTP